MAADLGRLVVVKVSVLDNKPDGLTVTITPPQDIEGITGNQLDPVFFNQTFVETLDDSYKEVDICSHNLGNNLGADIDLGNALNCHAALLRQVIMGGTTTPWAAWWGTVIEWINGNEQPDTPLLLLEIVQCNKVRKYWWECLLAGGNSDNIFLGVNLTRIAIIRVRAEDEKYSVVLKKVNIPKLCVISKAGGDLYEFIEEWEEEHISEDKWTPINAGSKGHQPNLRNQVPKKKRTSGYSCIWGMAHLMLRVHLN